MGATLLQKNAISSVGPRATLRVSSRPIDMAYLAVQTMEDRALEQEILHLFVRQAQLAASQIRSAGADDRHRIAHTLKGSARSIGAFALADCLEQVEAGNKQAIARVGDLVEQVCDFVAAISR